MEFLRSIRGKTLPVNVILVGKCGTDLLYCEQVQAELPHEVKWESNWSTDAEIINALTSSIGLIHAPLVDCNPRVVYEALWAGIPFLVNANARIPRNLWHLGRVVEDVGSEIEAFVNDIIVNRKWSRNEQESFAKEFLTENEAYSALLKYFE